MPGAIRHVSVVVQHHRSELRCCYVYASFLIILSLHTHICLQDLKPSVVVMMIITLILVIKYLC